MITHGSSVLGIDTHKDTHVAVILDGLGRPQGTRLVPATDAGAAQLLAWSRGHGTPLTAGVEGTGSYGYQLTRALHAAGVTVLEVNRPDRANRRRKGKSDPVDAEAAARAVLAGQASAVPKNREGAVEALRALTMARNSAVKATTTASHQIKALLVGAEQDLRDQLRVQSLLQLANRASQLAASSGLHTALASLGRRWLALHNEVLELDRATSGNAFHGGLTVATTGVHESGSTSVLYWDADVSGPLVRLLGRARRWPFSTDDFCGAMES
jgi:transposase